MATASGPDDDASPAPPGLAPPLGAGPDVAERVIAAIEMLEHLERSPETLVALDQPLRIRLMSLAGRLSRPDRYVRKALAKAAVRERARRTRAQDDALLAQTGIRALRREPVFRTPLPMPSQALEAAIRDEPVGDGDEVDTWAAAEAQRGEASRGPSAGAAPRTLVARHCYICKGDFQQLHDFYDQMCPRCAEFNWRKRNASADLRGRVVLVTGARVKIGYQAAIKCLRAGAETVVVTRFPRDAARRFATEADAGDWLSRLHVYGCDLRHTPSVETLCQHLVATLPRLDGLINNACQTVRRPSGWYDHLLGDEATSRAALPPAERAVLDRFFALRDGADGRARLADAPADADSGRASRVTADGDQAAAVGLWRSAVLSQVPLLADDLERGSHLYPSGRLDADLQQVDLREFNSWRMTMTDVPVAELLEVHLVNAVAPFVLGARLKPLMARVPTRDTHIVNVSAMEGQFYRRWKTDKHPHTNMAKAALNMMTRTSAADYVKSGIHMNAVDTGWVTDEDPVQIAARKQAEHGFHPPLDIVDGAARIVDPLFDGITTGQHLWGLFLKDYKPAPW